MKFTVPLEVARLRQVPGRGQQHGGVAVVAAGVHAAVVLRAVREVVLLLQRQRVQVGAQADGALAVAAAQHADDAGAGDAGVHLEAPFAQLVGHDLRGAVLLEAEFRVGMDVAAQRDEAGDVREGVDDVHVFIRRAAFDHEGQRGDARVRVHAEAGQSAGGLDIDQVKEHERLQDLAQVPGAHEPRDRPVRAAPCPVGDGAGLRGNRRWSCGLPCCLQRPGPPREVVQHAGGGLREVWEVVEALALLPDAQELHHADVHALRTGAICISTATSRSCSTARAAPTPP
jgi:hypothetical protein